MLQVFEEHFLNRDVFFDDESNTRNRLVDMQSFTVMSLEFKIGQSAVKESISVFAKRCSDTRNNILTNPSFLNGKDIHSQCLGLINVGIQRVGIPGSNLKAVFFMTGMKCSVGSKESFLPS